MTYSIDAGLESMLHRYKDRGVAWLRRPLASLLTNFLNNHSDCIDDNAHGIDVAMFVPSDNRDRGFNHLDQLVRGVFVGDPIFERFDWSPDAIERDLRTSRPARGELKPGAYSVTPRSVHGQAVLLLDDVWTSGSSASSAAAALKSAGAAHVTVVALGRQLNLSDRRGSTSEVYDDRCSTRWISDECVLCR
ncbi:hypothetical protein EXE59_09940 [Nocardioides eburneiflavus]|uniref:Phosphoribosyltransferase domain-containing protein n=1 Tax=Nocardioides eburneiflavus TaxID=2518372 RepID=A0A4Z1CG90_9ACTN|nr:hypothetical protein [Nocardioides eburneiflavus]TGN64237.1 hypothetical protein EXE59_09940 [Nocardioides eburneiflavus]